MENLETEKYNCYRSYLVDYLSYHGYTYRSFAVKYGAYLSFPMLSKVLRRDGRGNFIKEVSIKPERLAALLRAMDLPMKSVAHLILCRLENDQQVGRYRYSSVFNQILKDFRISALSSKGQPKGSGLDVENKKSDAKRSIEDNFLKALEYLHPTRREKVLDELKLQLVIEAERSTSGLKTQRTHALLKQLK